jgi:hypothetical protein
VQLCGRYDPELRLGFWVCLFEELVGEAVRATDDLVGVENAEFGQVDVTMGNQLRPGADAKSRLQVLTTASRRTYWAWSPRA